MTIFAFKAKVKDDTELVSACVCVSVESLGLGIPNILNRPALFHFWRVYLLFSSSFSQEPFFSSIQLGINYVWCCEFSLFTAGSGLRGTVTQSRPFSGDCSKVKNEPHSSMRFLLTLFNERTGEDGARYSLTLNSSVCRFISVYLSSSLTHSPAHFGALKFPPLKPFIILVNPSRTCPVQPVRLNWTDLFTDSLFFSDAVPCMPFERVELAFPCSSNESGSCPFQSLFLPSNNPLCCSALIWLRSFSAGFNTEVRVCRTGKTVKGILGTRTVTFPVQPPTIKEYEKTKAQSKAEL